MSHSLQFAVWRAMILKPNLWLKESSFTFFSTAVLSDIPHCLYEKASAQPLPRAIIRPPTHGVVPDNLLWKTKWAPVESGVADSQRWKKGGGASWLLRKWNTFGEICSLSTRRECFVAAGWSLDELIFSLRVQTPSGSLGSRWIAACSHRAIFALARGHCWPPFDDS